MDDVSLGLLSPTPLVAMTLNWTTVPGTKPSTRQDTFRITFRSDFISHHFLKVLPLNQEELQKGPNYNNPLFYKLYIL